MLRPHYPLIYKRDEMPDANSISEVCVVIDDDDDTWKAGDMVDWNSDGAYWSTRVTEVLTDDKVKIELPMPPAGERKDDETHEALCKDLRPNLVWSQRKDWSLPTNGKTHVVHGLFFHQSKVPQCSGYLEASNLTSYSTGHTAQHDYSLAVSNLTLATTRFELETSCK
ncbi:uncharacterized protein [Rutidosis leptorrhynchoides]|uniref:uncharacterized protein isoform X2 n=1 Tax=Rutidosis leptorrhynchoides TaxID=125765 RepID=UPI003A9A236D